MDRRWRLLAIVSVVSCWAQQVRAHEPPIDRPEPEPTYTSKVLGKPQTTASERVVEQKTIALTPKGSGDDLLRFVPSLLVTRHGAEGKASQIYLRGFDAVHGADLEVLAGGVPLNELSNIHGQGYLDLGIVIPEVVLSLDALKGSFQLHQGNFATAGSLRLTLGVPEQARGGRLSYEGGMFNRHRLLAVVAPRGRAEPTFLAVEGMRQDGYGQNRDSERITVNGQALLWRREHRGAIEAFVLGQATRFGEPAAVPQADVDAAKLGFFDVYARTQRGSAGRGIVGLRYRLEHHADSAEVVAYAQWRRLQLAESFTGYLVDAVRGDTRYQFQDAWSGGVRLRYQRRLPHGWVLLSGADWMSERISQFEDRVADEGQPYQRTRDLAIDQHQGGLLVGARYRPRDWVRVEGGVRLDAFHFAVEDRVDAARSASGTFVQPSPRLTLAFFAPRGVSLFAAYGRGVRAPEARAVIRQPVRGENDPSIPSEFKGGAAGLTASDALELGLRWRFRDVLELGAAGFATFIANEVVFDHVSGINVALNATRRVGVELELKVSPVPWLELRADATWVDARFVESAGPIPGAPIWMASLGAWLFDWRGLHAGARFIYVAPRPLAFGAISSAITTLDVTAGYRWRWLQADVTVTNLTDARWKEGEFNYASWFDRSEARSVIPRLHFTAGPPIAARAGLTLWF